MNTYQITDIELLESIKTQIHLNKNRAMPNTGKIHRELFLGWPGMRMPGMENFWDDKLDLYKKLCDVTYPYGEEIINSTVKFYEKGDYASLHQDSLNYLSHSKKVKSAWTNSVLIEQSSDIEGGTIVICGDGWEPNFEQIKSRLITINHRIPGDTAVWDDRAVHGVSKLTNGYRICLIVIKERDLNNG